MTEADRIKYLRIALLLVGLIFTFGIYPLTIIWPAGWSWHMGQSDYLQMILGIYATLGVFLMVASRNPLAYISLMVYSVVQRCACRHYGGSSVCESHAPGTPFGRRASAPRCSGCACAFDATWPDRTARLRARKGAEQRRNARGSIRFK